MPDYRVSLAEKIIPAAELSEQISTAGTEASGTGNMKFAMNGALTIGTLDGANVEILEEVGAGNMYVFGLRTEESERAAQFREAYDPRNSAVRTRGSAACSKASPTASSRPRSPASFGDIRNEILSPRDPYVHFADLGSYIETKRQISSDYADRSSWTRKAILNVARMGKFSSDRTVSGWTTPTRYGT